MTESHESAQEATESSSVRVAVRIRPFIKKELVENPQTAVTCDPEHNAVVLGRDRQFEFDKVFSVEAKQVEVFEYCVKDLVLSCFSGYNATVLAYGQTGSGKTYTMGSGQRMNVLEEEVGIIPRVISYIVEEANKRKPEFEFILKVAFLEIYNEEILDLLDPKPGGDKQIIIREDRGTISLMGMHEEKVATYEEMVGCLDKGSLNRSTAATLMNELSSRSHAIFTISIEQHAVEEGKEEEEGQGYTCAKFHFVDLAGSERAKRTGASGTTMKEGISINKGLLCLGNVISALTEDSKKNVHVPYRDSKLTRILQDSLGGNSKTCMIACVSPAETNYEETLNTLKYASRARHIKNKPVINRDPNSALIAQLRQEIFHLKGEVKAYQRVIATGDLSEISVKGMAAYQDEDETRQLKITSQQLEKKVAGLGGELAEKSAQIEGLEVKLFSIQRERDVVKGNLERAVDILRTAGIDFTYESTSTLADDFAATVSELQSKVKQLEQSNRELAANFETLQAANERDLLILQRKTQELDQLKRQSAQSFASASKLVEEQELFASIPDYGKLFAASILETIEHSAADTASESHPEEPPSEEVEVDPAQEVNLEKQESEIHSIEGAISQKEEMLKCIEDTLHQMQTKLMAEMNQQYHKKISDLEAELRALEREKESTISKLSSASEKKIVEDRYRAQVQQLEEKLRDNKKKDREQTALYKTLETQKAQITKLADEIQKAKQQKLLLVKKHKAEVDSYQKWKAERTKELLLAKKMNLKKDQQIAKLIQESKKKEGVAKRKAEELASLQKRQKEIIGRLKGKGNEEVDVLRQWVAEFIHACVSERTVKERLTREVQELAELISDVDRMREVAADITLKLDRCQLEYDSPDPSQPLQDLSLNIQSLQLGRRSVEDQLETLEMNLRHKQEKVEELRESLAASPVEDIRARCTALRTLADTQNLIAVLFEEVVTATFRGQELELSLRRADVDLEAARAEIRSAQQENELAKVEHHRAEERLKAELREQEMRWLEEMKSQQHIIVPVEPTDDTDLERRCSDLESQLAEKDRNIETLKRQMEASAKITKKTSGELKEANSEAKKPPAGFTSLKQARDKRLLKGKKPEEEEKLPIVKGTDSRRGSQAAIKPLERWKCLQTTEAHAGQVSALCCFENMLFTASNKSFKVWSVDQMSQISEIPAHTSFIRAMTFWSENNLVLTGCQGSISIWDTISLQSIGLLSDHNDEIRTMKMFDRYLISAGKSTNNFSLFVWDLRRNQRPVAEMEPRNDIHAIEVCDNTLFYAGKDKAIHRVNLANFEPMESVPNVHADTITGIGELSGVVMSASSDKAVKLWSPSTGQELGSVSPAHSDAVLCLESDTGSSSAFTGSKDGKMKLWRLSGGLTCSAELLGHRGPVNCIGVVKSGETVVSGSGDRCVKLWRPCEDGEEQ